MVRSGVVHHDLELRKIVQSAEFSKDRDRLQEQVEALKSMIGIPGHCHRELSRQQTLSSTFQNTVLDQSIHPFGTYSRFLSVFIVQQRWQAQGGTEPKPPPLLLPKP